MLVIPLIKIDDLPINVFDCNKGIHYYYESCMVRNENQIT